MILSVIILPAILSGLVAAHDVRNICHVAFVPPFIQLVPCSSEVRVVTIAGVMDMNCDQIRRAQFFGQVTLIQNNCTVSLQTNPVCKTLVDQSPYRIGCRESPHVIVIISVVTTILFTTAALFWMRWMWLTRRGAKRIEQVKINGKRVNLELSKETGNGIRDRKSFSMSLLIFSLFFMGLHNPTWAATLESLIVGKGSSFQIDDLSVKVIDGSIYFPLIHEYDTYLFSTSASYWYECSRDHCNLCDEGGEVWSTRTITFYNHQSVLKKSFCKWGTTLGSCFFTTGCQRAEARLEFHDSDLLRVYSFATPVVDIKITSTPSSSCDLKSGVARGINFSGVKLVRKMNEVFLCKEDSPEAIGRLDSVRIDRTGTYRSSDSTIKCNHDLSSGFDCWSSVLKSLSHCTKLPSDYQDMTLSFNGDSMRVTGPAIFEIEVSCNGTSIDFNEACGGIEYILRGTDYSTKGVVMTVKPRVISKGVSWIGTPKCLHGEMIVPCDGEGSSFVVPVDSSCLKGLEVRKEIIEEQFRPELDAIVASQFAVVPDSGAHESLKEFYSRFWYLPVSATTLLLMGILLLLCLKKCE